jgi:metal-responsive CopG/Arc/MetJ family transcriptional regulator
MRTAIKTAISVDTETYRSVDRLARRLHISRSQFFTQAARHMIDRSENLDLLRRINESFVPDQAESTRLAHEKAYARRKASAKW